MNSFIFPPPNLSYYFQYKTRNSVRKGLETAVPLAWNETSDICVQGGISPLCTALPLTRLIIAADRSAHTAYSSLSAPSNEIDQTRPFFFEVTPSIFPPPFNKALVFSWRGGGYSKMY